MKHFVANPPQITAFFTVALARPASTLLMDRIDVLRAAVRHTHRRRPFEIVAWVVLPDHMHAVWSLPADDPNASDRWGAIKARFSKEVRLIQPDLEADLVIEPLPGAAPTNSPAKIWRTGFLSRRMESRAMTLAHIRRCYTDPVRHGLVRNPQDWPCSSLHRDLRQGRQEVLPERVL